MTTPSITHARALDLAGSAPAFPLDGDASRELAAHLRACPDCARRAAGLRADARAIGQVDPVVSPRLHDRIREAAVTPPHSGPSALGIVIVLVLLAVGAVGASIGAGAFLAAKPAPSAPAAELAARADDAVRWHTDVVDLAATELRIDANDLTFTGMRGTALHSDPGSLQYWTLEATWNEQGREQRLNLYFAADQAAWWIREVRVYDGAANREADWARFPPGPYAKTPLGVMFEGDLDLAGSSNTGPVRLRLDGLRIAVRPSSQVFEPVGGGIVLPGEGANPFRPGGALHCSGIMQLPPMAAEARLLTLGYRLSWRWEYATGPSTGYAEARKRAPATGWISDAAVGSSGELIVFVQDPARPSTVGGPPSLPADCPTPAP